MRQDKRKRVSDSHSFLSERDSGRETRPGKTEKILGNQPDFKDGWSCLYLKMSKKLPCDYKDCKKTFSSVFNRQRHINVCHLGLKPFQCQDCLKFFASKQNLEEHEFVHARVPLPEETETRNSVTQGEVIVPRLTDLVLNCDDLDLLPMLHIDRVYPFPPTREYPTLPSIKSPPDSVQTLPNFGYVQGRITSASQL